MSNEEAEEDKKERNDHDLDNGSKVDLNPIVEDETINEKLSEASSVQVINVHVDGSTLNDASHQSHESNSLSNVLKTPSVEVDQGVAITTRPGYYLMYESFPKRSVINRREIDGGSSIWKQQPLVFGER
ncbi:putative protein-like [Forsythia ovata]|uniref:Uncharacterized protein n=1 Tax=Forsythia ovata TaxID=205694 RepID=A0ABD1T504_9LAMI